MNDLKYRIWNSYLKYLWISFFWSLFLFFDFLAKILEAHKNWQKSSLILQYSFAQKISPILWTSTRLTLEIICSRNAAKKISHFANFSDSIFMFGVRQNISTTSFLDAQELHSWSTLKSVRKYLFHRRSKTLCGWEEGWWRAWIISLMRIAARPS